MKKINLLIGILAMGIVGFVSCKKSSSTTDPIVGKWKVTQTADDVNGNGVMDADEVATDSSNSFFTLNGNGTGTATETLAGVPLSENFNWVYVANKTWLQTTLTSSNIPFAVVGTVASNHIDNLSASTMTLKDTAGGISWTILTKQ